MVLLQVMVRFTGFILTHCSSSPSCPGLNLLLPLLFTYFLLLIPLSSPFPVVAAPSLSVCVGLKKCLRSTELHMGVLLVDLAPYFLAGCFLVDVCVG